ncbi:pilus assembly protein [Sulfitobacter sp. F26204]|uniref:TadE/TadG family type IV pilus assembly protein n=1 Tax=Sulfitobacter sp. F26204 TaxID=2996014 RepID=UPI00225E4916|nr:TadE/TadG family type IV pilus assembly protein [Sulfitobacter sp. F26204]MCX7561609.1 pilus assembly protein [Sulfitobacter sp. F26204]
MTYNPISFLNTFRRDQSGAVAIEFVLIAPLLFGLVFGIIVIGYFIGVSHSVAQLATDAVRASVAGLDMQERTELAAAYLADASLKYPLLIQESVSPQIITSDANPPSMTVNVTYEIDGSVLAIANSFLGLNIADIKGSSFLAY